MYETSCKKTCPIQDESKQIIHNLILDQNSLEVTIPFGATHCFKFLGPPLDFSLFGIVKSVGMQYKL